MKRFLIIPFLGCLILLSCSKVSRVERQAIKGSYDWYYSYNGFAESFSSQETEDKFGIHIKGNGNVFLYKNDEEVLKGKITEFVSSSANFIVKWNKWDQSTFTINDNQISYKVWPFSEHTNYFNKYVE